MVSVARLFIFCFRSKLASHPVEGFAPSLLEIFRFLRFLYYTAAGTDVFTPANFSLLIRLFLRKTSPEVRVSRINVVLPTCPSALSQWTVTPHGPVSHEAGHGPQQPHQPWVFVPEMVADLTVVEGLQTCGLRAHMCAGWCFLLPLL